METRVGRERTFTAENHRFRRYLLLSLVARQSPGIDCPNVLLWRPNIWALLSFLPFSASCPRPCRPWQCSQNPCNPHNATKTSNNLTFLKLHRHVSRTAKPAVRSLTLARPSGTPGRYPLFSTSSVADSPSSPSTSSLAGTFFFLALSRASSMAIVFFSLWSSFMFQFLSLISMSILA